MRQGVQKYYRARCETFGGLNAVRCDDEVFQEIFHGMGLGGPFVSREARPV